MTKVFVVSVIDLLSRHRASSIVVQSAAIEQAHAINDVSVKMSEMWTSFGEDSADPIWQADQWDAIVAGESEDYALVVNSMPVL